MNANLEDVLQFDRFSHAERSERFAARLAQINKAAAEFLMQEAIDDVQDVTPAVDQPAFSLPSSNKGAI